MKELEAFFLKDRVEDVLLNLLSGEFAQAGYTVVGSRCDGLSHS